jgi:hypothetical protein
MKAPLQGLANSSIQRTTIFSEEFLQQKVDATFLRVERDLHGSLGSSASPNLPQVE